MRQLLKVYATAFQDWPSYQSRPPGDRYLKSLLKSRNFISLVAIANHQVIGGLSAYIFPKFEQERSEIYIYDLAVLSNFRRQGIATNLIKHLQKLGAKKGAWVIFVQADPVDLPAVKLYQKLGILEKVFHFDIQPIA